MLFKAYEVLEKMRIELPETFKHCSRVGGIMERIADSARLEPYIVEAAYMHDIGKLCIDKSIIEKDGKLNDVEYECIKIHSEAGYRMAQCMGASRNICEAIRKHHERMDCMGYPLGVNDAKFEVKLLSIVDTFDAMTIDRTYRTSVSVAEALREIQQCSETQFDPVAVKVFTEFIRNNNQYTKVG